MEHGGREGGINTRGRVDGPAPFPLSFATVHDGTCANQIASNLLDMSPVRLLDAGYVSLDLTKVILLFVKSSGQQVIPPTEIIYH